MQIPNKALSIIESFEGWSSRPYWDSYGRVYTRGFGETEGIGPNSPSITREQGRRNLAYRLKRFYAPSIEALNVPLNENQFSALLSFVWNLGPGSMAWDVGRSLREKKYMQAADEMLQYDHAGGVRLAGLTRRREEERRLFLTPAAPIRPANPLDVLFTNERRTVNSYLKYHKHPNLHIHGLKVAKQEMTLMRQNIYSAAAYGHLFNSRKRTAKGWDINNRLARYAILKKYTK